MERYVVKEDPDSTEGQRFYVQDTALGYCTPFTYKANAERDARRMNRENERGDR